MIVADTDMSFALAVGVEVPPGVSRAEDVQPMRWRDECRAEAPVTLRVHFSRALVEPQDKDPGTVKKLAECDLSVRDRIFLPITVRIEARCFTVVIKRVDAEIKSGWLEQVSSKLAVTQLSCFLASIQAAKVLASATVSRPVRASTAGAFSNTCEIKRAIGPRTQVLR